MRLEPDLGAEARGEAFFRSAEFLEAEGVTHSLIVECRSSRAAIPLVVREIEGAGGAMDAISPYSYPGGELRGDPIDPAEVELEASGLVSVFVRDRLGEPPTLLGATERGIVLVSDPGLPPKSRMSDRQQIRKNVAAGYVTTDRPGPETTAEQQQGFHRVYTETMEHVDAGARYLFDPGYFDLLLRSERSRLFSTAGPDGDLAAAALVVESDGFIHYYLSGTAGEHRRRAPSKNLIAAVTDYATERGMPMNLGGGLKPGDGLEEFKRGFGNRELPFRTHELICDPGFYAELSAATPPAAADFFPLYRGG